MDLLLDILRNEVKTRSARLFWLIRQESAPRALIRQERERLVKVLSLLERATAAGESGLPPGRDRVVLRLRPQSAVGGPIEQRSLVSGLGGRN